MSYDEDREIALITLSQSQRSFLTMTIIDTTLYANGALRLARHGAGKGGTVLLHTASGNQISLPEDNDAANIILDEIENGYGPIAIYNEVARRYRQPLFRPAS